MFAFLSASGTLVVEDHTLANSFSFHKIFVLDRSVIAVGYS